MPIRVEHSSSTPLVGRLSGQTGRRQLRQRGNAQLLDAEKFLLGFEANQRQADIANAFRAEQLADSRRARDDAQLLRQQQLQGQLADREQARLAALAADQQNFAQQAELEAFQQANINARQQSELDQRLGLAGVEGLEKQAAEALAFAQKMNLTPEGKRKLHELNQGFRAVQGGVGVQFAYGSPQHQEVIGQFLQEFDKSGLEDFEQQEPDPQELWAAQTYTSEDGAVFGLDRNGTFRKLKDPPVRQLAPEEIAANTYPLSNGTTMFVNPLDGKVYFPPPPKPEEEKSATGIPQDDFLKYFNIAQQSIIVERKLEAEGKENATAKPPTVQEVRERMKELWSMNMAAKGADEQLNGNGDDEEDADNIITAPDGARARLNSDGTVTPL